MRIEMLTGIAGNAGDGYHDRDFSYAHGQVIEVPDALGRAWIASGVAQAALPGQRLGLSETGYVIKRRADGTSEGTVRWNG